MKIKLPTPIKSHADLIHEIKIPEYKRVDENGWIKLHPSTIEVFIDPEEWWRIKKVRGYHALGIKFDIDDVIYYLYPTYEMQAKLMFGIIHISKLNDIPQYGQPNSYKSQFEDNFSSFKQYITNLYLILKKYFGNDFMENWVKENDNGDLKEWYGK